MRGSAILTAFFVLATAAALAGDLPSSDVIATAAGPVKVYPVEHATFVMEWNGKTIAVDPIGGAEAFVAHPEADLVLITDIHGDHLSVDTVASLTKPETKVVVPAAAAEAFPEADRSSFSVIANGESIEWAGRRHVRLMCDWSRRRTATWSRRCVPEGSVKTSSTA